jgi:hypothetical protein
MQSKRWISSKTTAWVFVLAAVCSLQRAKREKSPSSTAALFFFPFSLHYIHKTRQWLEIVIIDKPNLLLYNK